MQTWDPEKYRNQAGFVANELGGDLLAVLAPRSGEHILDIGCGDGIATQKICASGASVWGFDASPEQIAAAQALGLNVVVADAQTFSTDQQFDAAFSNATLHWVADTAASFRQIHQVLKPQARFVAECGGAGNISAILLALEAVLPDYGRDLASCTPWHFRSPETYQQQLEDSGFAVTDMQHFARPVRLDGDISGWVDTFCGDFLGDLPSDAYHAAIDDIVTHCRPALCDSNGQWHADYVRVRFTATRIA